MTSSGTEVSTCTPVAKMTHPAKPDAERSLGQNHRQQLLFLGEEAGAGVRSEAG